MRPLVSYDDIATPAPEQTSSPTHGTSCLPPKKRQKNNHRQQQRHGEHRSQVDGEDYNGDRAPPRKLARDYGLKEESRQLTHEEIWDDSALIRAWDAAAEEYKVLNGPDKKWKSEPLHKSALWFNIPPEETRSSTAPSGSSFMPIIPNEFASQIEDQEDGSDDPENSRPVNFNTFVPRHDPLSSGSNNHTAAGALPLALPGVSDQVTKDEAFERAMGAWYWAGYWTGIYHSASSKPAADTTQEYEAGEHEASNEIIGGTNDHESKEAEGEDIQIGEDLIPT